MKKKEQKKKEVITKMVFIDTSIFVDTNLEQLNRILKILNKKKFILILPEVIRHEVNFLLKETFLKKEENLGWCLKGIDKYIEDMEKEKSIKKGNKRRINKEYRKIKKILLKQEKDLTSRKKEENMKKQKIIQKIFTSKNKEDIPLNNEIIFLGIKRSLTHKAPFTNKSGEAQHKKDVDCIAFESIMFYLRDNKTERQLIICVRDGDYNKKDKDNKATQEIHKDIKNDLKKYYTKVKGYKSLTELLEKEFGEKISEKEKKEEKEENKRYEEYREFNNNGLLSNIFSLPTSSSLIPDGSTILSSQLVPNYSAGFTYLAKAAPCSECGKKYNKFYKGSIFERHICEDCRNKIFFNLTRVVLNNK